MCRWTRIRCRAVGATDYGQVPTVLWCVRVWVQSSTHTLITLVRDCPPSGQPIQWFITEAVDDQEDSELTFTDDGLVI